MIPVTGVTLDKSLMDITIGGSGSILASVEPSNATDQSITWSTSDSTIATVASGLVVGISAGNATITATTVDGNFTADCNSLVTISYLGSIYGEMLDFFPEQFRTVIYFNQNALLNNSYGDRENESRITVIVQNNTTETKDQNGNLVTVNGEFVWSFAKLNDGWFIDFEGIVYRIVTDDNWPTEGRFYRYKIEKMTGTPDANNTSPTFNIGGKVA